MAFPETITIRRQIVNSFGRVLRVSIFGESHGEALGIVVDGCPAGVPLTLEDFEPDLGRRRSGAKGTTPRQEADAPELLSGVANETTTGAPLTIIFRNQNVRSADYAKLKDVPRPGHADFVARVKFGGFADRRGGGHFSGRVTVGLVAAGVIAKKLLGEMDIQARLIEAGGSEDIDRAVDRGEAENDSVGGIIECRVNNVPAGLGEPFFDSLESQLAHIVFAIPAIRGLEFGTGFRAASMFGSQHNDNIVDVDGTTETNHAGGINGGISNGNEIVFRIAVKPPSSISRAQRTMNMQTGKLEDLTIEGRHDKCIALRVPPVLEAATAIVLADCMLLQQEVKRIHNGS